MSEPITKMTDDYIDGLIDEIHYMTHKTLTVCVLTLSNGCMLTGESNVILPANYDAHLGRQHAFKAARDKIWQHEGYAIKRDLNK